MATNPVAKNPCLQRTQRSSSSKNYKGTSLFEQLPWHLRLVDHEPVLERLKAPTTDAMYAVHTFVLKELVGVWITPVGRLFSHVHVGTGKL